MGELFEGLLRQERDQGAKAEQQQRALELLLANEVVQNGLRVADAKIAERLGQLQADGKSVRERASGLTLEGSRVVVHDYADVPYPGGVEDGDWETWHGTHEYSIFIFGLQETMRPDFADGLSERQIEEAEDWRGATRITIEDPSSEDGVAKLYLPNRPGEVAKYRGEVIHSLTQ